MSSRMTRFEICSKLTIQLSDDVSDIVLLSLLLTLNIFIISSTVFNVNFEQEDVWWDDNDKNIDDNSHDEDVDRAVFKKVYFNLSKLGAQGR